MNTAEIVTKPADLESNLTLLRAEAAQLQVKDQVSYTRAAQLIRRGRDILKIIDAMLDPGIRALREQKREKVGQVNQIIVPLEFEAEAWRSTEKALAQLEQESVSDGIVQPNIPTVAGIRGRTNYYGVVIDEDALIEAYAKACAERQIKRKAFLRQFICADTQAINAEARRIKDPAKLQRLVPGVRGEAKESI